ncbi:hypothetical protein GQ600_26036 [Phytophthora cactorum]|nr:hypothetical protein GQ600_26036 [Phytophthora cactorum]
MNYTMDSLLRMAASAGPPQREQKKDFEKGKWPSVGKARPILCPPIRRWVLRVSEVLGRADKQAESIPLEGRPIPYQPSQGYTSTTSDRSPYRCEHRHRKID